MQEHGVAHVEMGRQLKELLSITKEEKMETALANVLRQLP
jgi:hypothetical protein